MQSSLLGLKINGIYEGVNIIHPCACWWQTLQTHALK